MNPNRISSHFFDELSALSNQHSVASASWLLTAEG